MSSDNNVRDNKKNINFIGDAVGQKILSLLDKETPILNEKRKIDERERKAELEKELEEDNAIEYVNKDKIIYRGKDIPSFSAAALTSTAISYDAEKQKRLLEKRSKQVVRITKKGCAYYFSIL